MSHFTVMVIGDNPEEQLAAYQENNMGDCPMEYMEFNDTEPEVRKQYEEEDEETKAKYPDFKSYIEEYHGYKIDEEQGKYGYWENPNAKWDWYQLGGRWSGMLKIKPGATGTIGETSWMSQGAAGIDQAKKGDIDLGLIRKEQADKAVKQYQLAMSIFGEHPTNESWATIRDRNPENTETAREDYWNQPRCKAWKDEQRKDFLNFPFGFHTTPDEFLISEEQYKQKAIDGALTTFAVIKDGKWHERGKMGWWAMVSDKMEEADWNKEFAKLFDETPDDTLISIYDCHI